MREKIKLAHAVWIAAVVLQVIALAAQDDLTPLELVVKLGVAYMSIAWMMLPYLEKKDMFLTYFIDTPYKRGEDDLARAVIFILGCALFYATLTAP